MYSLNSLRTTVDAKPLARNLEGRKQRAAFAQKVAASLFEQGKQEDAAMAYEVARHLREAC